MSHRRNSAHADEDRVHGVKHWSANLAAMVALGALLAVLWPGQTGSPAERQAVREGRVLLTYWDRSSGHEFEARRALIEEFNQIQGRIYVRTLPIGFNTEKLLTSIAGGAPPDLCSLEVAILALLAPQGCFTPLEGRMSGVPALAQEAFFPHAWDGVAFDGHVWGIPTTTDTQCLLWNKGLFRKAGLDPERPPRTLAELEEYAARLTVRDAAGELTQMGFLPWLPWDFSHMWGALFGGTWYDADAGRAVCGRDPAIAATFAWQQGFALNPSGGPAKSYALDPERVAAFRSGFGAYQSASNPFYTGKVAMMIEGEWQVTFIPKYAPTLDWGVAPIPQPEGVAPRAYASAVVMDAIPAGSRHVEEAWAFLRWFYSPRADGRPSPASDYAFAVHNIPARRGEAMQSRFMDDPKFAVFVRELLDKPVEALPAIPVAQLLIDEAERQREFVNLYKRTPQEAAAAVEATVNNGLEHWRAARERGERP